MIRFNSDSNKRLSFTSKMYLEGIHKPEKQVVITSKDKVHLKCNCVDGSIVNGVRAQVLHSFYLSAPPGYEFIKKPTTVLYNKKKTKQDSLHFFLEDSNHNPLQFNNNETLIITFQIKKKLLFINRYKFKIKSYCVGSKHYSDTASIRVDLIQNKKLVVI